MTTSKSKGRFFYKTNRFESIRITNRIDSNRELVCSTWWHFSEQRWEWSGGCVDRLPSKELRERLGIDDIALVLPQNRLRWYGHLLQTDDDWVKKCMEYEVQGPRPDGRPKRTWREVVREDCQARKMNRQDRWKWRKMVKDIRWSEWVWVGECFFWYRPTRLVPDQRPLNGCMCVCVCVCVSCHKNGISASFTFHEAKLHIIIRRHLALPLPETNLLVS